MQLSSYSIRGLFLVAAAATILGCAPDNGSSPEVSVDENALFGFPPSISWRPPFCSGATFAGCNVTGQPRCTDAGGPYYANWDPAMWNVCQTACSQPNPDSYCAWTPAQCAGSTFTGCSRVGQPVCTDWGGPSFPNWNDAAWSACQ